MSSSTFYQKIIEELTEEKIIKLMEQLGATSFKDRPEALVFPTICHNLNAEEASQKLYYYKDNHFFYCYTNCGGQSIFNFLRNYYNLRGIEYNWQTDIVDKLIIPKKQTLIIPERERLRDLYQKRVSIELPTYPISILSCFTEFYTPEWEQEGISKEVMKKYLIRFSTPDNKIIIPHLNIRGELIGIRGRALNQWEVENVGKYMPVQIEGKWYSHKLSLNLYGLNYNLEAIKRNKIVYLVEGEKSVLKIDGFDMENCSVAVCGSNFNKYQLNLLLKNCYPEEIVICFDKEEEGNSSTYFKKLYDICKKYAAYCKMSFIYDRENLLDLKDSPVDKGEEVFKKLLESRVKIN